MTEIIIGCEENELLNSIHRQAYCGIVDETPREGVFCRNKGLESLVFVFDSEENELDMSSVLIPLSVSLSVILK